MRRLTVLGTCAAWPQAGRAASGFLLEYDGFRFVLDLGYGTFPRLLELCAGSTIGAVAVTHEHPDHCADLSALSRERYFSGGRGVQIPLYCTPGVVDRVQAMEPSESLLDVFEVHHLPGRYQVGPFQLDALALPHHVPHAGIRISAPGLTIAYSGDAGADDALARLGADADLFIIGATLQESASEGGDRLLSSAAEAGEWARRANARHLLLTHFRPDDDRSVSLAQARSAFSDEVTIAEEGLVIPL